MAAVLLGGMVLVAARRFRWLTASGALAGGLVGLAVVAGTGWFGLLPLLFFFVSASALSRLGSDRRSRKGERTGRRADQVAANGGMAAVVALAALAGWVPAGHYALVGAVAAATADTWATEIGSSGSWATWSVVGTGRVEPGCSGGVSVPGTLAGIAGAAIIGAIAAGLDRPVAGSAIDGPAGWLAVAVLAGTAGMFADSVLGATLEDRLGILGNEEVNVVCTLVGAATAWGLAGHLG